MRKQKRILESYSRSTRFFIIAGLIFLTASLAVSAFLPQDIKDQVSNFVFRGRHCVGPTFVSYEGIPTQTFLPTPYSPPMKCFNTPAEAMNYVTGGEVNLPWYTSNREVADAIATFDASRLLPTVIPTSLPQSGP